MNGVHCDLKVYRYDRYTDGLIKQGCGLELNVLSRTMQRLASLTMTILVSVVMLTTCSIGLLLSRNNIVFIIKTNLVPRHYVGLLIVIFKGVHMENRAGAKNVSLYYYYQAQSK